MAGHRRGTGRPTRAQARRSRRRARLVSRLGRARSPVERVTAAAEYARGALRDMESFTAESVARELVEHLVATVDQAVTNGR